jgi:hypothetical protein
MPFAIEKSFPFEDQRRHPRRIIRINLPWKFDERIALAARGYF